MQVPRTLLLLLLVLADADGLRVAHNEQQTLKAASAFSDTIDNFASSPLPDGVLNGLYVTSGAPLCGILMSIRVQMDSRQYGPYNPGLYSPAYGGPMGGPVGGPVQAVVSALDVCATLGREHFDCQ